MPDLADRQDLRDVPFVTIDGSDARDFDDAVWAEADQRPSNKGGWQIMVAIADVAYYVRPGTAFDEEARQRGNSIYFPDRVIPMLPFNLSNELCSLKPLEDRGCFVAHLRIDQEGNLISYRFNRALMRSAARLTYEQVQNAYDGKPDEITKPLGKAILSLYGAYHSFLKNRQHRGTCLLYTSRCV